MIAPTNPDGISCPSSETLVGVADLSTRDARFLAIDAHVENCPRCRRLVEGLTEEGDSDEPEDLLPVSRNLPDSPPKIPGYLLTREIGRGGNGVVYEARRTDIDRKAAVKVVSAGEKIGAEDRERRLREARAVGRLRHPNIVHLHDVGEHDHFLYIAFDLILGGSLASRMSRPLPAGPSVELIATIADAVEHVHRSGMLHLDVKPSNILLDGPPDGPWDKATPMLTDFGIARIGEDAGGPLDADGEVVGTPSYMAPEQIKGDRSSIGPAADVYALGATLHAMITGRPPFQAATVMETLDLVLHREPVPPRTLVPGLPRDLETIVLKCLRKEPSRRYASAAEMADDLRRFRDGFPIRARPVSVLERAGRWCRRRPGSAAILAASLLMTIASLVGLFTLWRRSEDALARVIAGEKAGIASVRELIELLGSTIDAPQLLPTERALRAAEVVRSLNDRLRTEPEFAKANLVSICDLECRLAHVLRRRNRTLETAKTILAECLSLIQGRWPVGTDPRLDEIRARIHNQLAMIERDARRYEPALIHRLESIRAAEAAHDLGGNPELVDDLDNYVSDATHILERLGRPAERRRIADEHLKRLKTWSERPNVDASVELHALLNQAAEYPGPESRFQLFEAIRRRPAASPLSIGIRFDLCELIAGEIDLDGSKLSDGELVDRILADLRSKCLETNRADEVMPLAAIRLSVRFCLQGTKQRAAGLANEAKRTTALLCALGRRLVQESPTVPEYRLVVCDGLQQKAKPFLKVDDLEHAEPILRRALAEARAALHLDPESQEARLRVAGLQDKLGEMPPPRPVQR